MMAEITGMAMGEWGMRVGRLARMVIITSAELLVCAQNPVTT